MSGNMREWCWDTEWEMPLCTQQEIIDNPHGASSGTTRSQRGGGWGDSARLIQINTRLFDNPLFF